jgi:hypothetical protein
LCAQLEAAAKAAGLEAGGAKTKTAGAEDEAVPGTIASRGVVTATSVEAYLHPVHSAVGCKEVEVEVEGVEECRGGADAARPAGAREEEVEESASSSAASSGNVTRGHAASRGVTCGGAASRGVTGGGEEDVEEESASASAHVHVSSPRKSAAAVGAVGLRKVAAVGAAAKAAAARGMTSPDRPARCFGTDVTNCNRAESRSPSPVSRRCRGVGAV